MSNIIDLEGGQEEEATAMAAFEPTPTMCLHSRMQILEEKEWRQWITHVMEEDQWQQLTKDKNKPTEGTNIIQATQPHNVNKQDNETTNNARPPTNGPTYNNHYDGEHPWQRQWLPASDVTARPTPHQRYFYQMQVGLAAECSSW